MSFDPNEYKNFCEAPFIGITIDPGGNIMACCNTFDKQQLANSHITEVDDLEEFFKGKQYERLRKQMTAVGPEGINNCKLCSNAKEGGEAEIKNYWRRAEQVFFKPGEPLKLHFLEMTTSNICNQTCVMCNSYFSTKWKKLEPHFIKSGLAEYRTVHPTMSYSEESTNKILKVLPNLKILMIKGGEPFADKNNLKILTRLAEVNPDCKVSLVSNFQHIPNEWWPVLEKLNNLEVGASVDGIEDTYNWIRGGDFNKVVQNIENYYERIESKRPRITGNGFSICMCISIYNLYNLRATQDYFKKYKQSFSNVVERPEYLSPAIVPKHNLLKCINSQYSYPEQKTMVANNLINIKQDPHASYRREKFKIHTNVMNNIRGFDIYDIEPKLKTIFDE